MSAPQQWTTSSYSNNGVNCVEVRGGTGAVSVRDTKNRTAGIVTVTAEQWTRFLSHQR